MKIEDAKELLEEFLNDELGEYIDYQNWEVFDKSKEGDMCYFEIIIKMENKNDIWLSFKVNNEQVIYIDLYGEGSWYEVDNYSYRVKYLWMVVLNS